MEDILVIGIAGGTGSGKTTLMKNLVAEFGDLVAVVSQLTAGTTLKVFGMELQNESIAVGTLVVLFAIGFVYPALVVIFLPSRTVAFATMLAYTVMQCLYTGFLKRVPYVDVATLSAGFVLRAVAGAAIISAYISPWLLVCTFTLSMFLALCKRRNEMEVARESRMALKGYHPRVLSALILLAGFASFGEYLAYTLTSKMGLRFPYLWATSVFVLLGILRYAVLAWRKGDVGRPERVLLTDRPLWAVLAGYAASGVAAVWITL